jgi:hypothetical protein
MPVANGYSNAVVASGPRGEQTVTAAKRLTEAAAHKLIGAPGRHLTPSVLGAVLVVIESGRVRVAQRARGAARRLGGGEAVAAQDVEVLVLERGQPGTSSSSDGADLGDLPGRPAHPGSSTRCRRSGPTE